MKYCVKYQNQDNNTRKAFVLTIKKYAADQNLLPAAGEKMKTPDNSLMFQEFGFIPTNAKPGGFCYNFLLTL